MDEFTALASLQPCMHKICRNCAEKLTKCQCPLCRSETEFASLGDETVVVALFASFQVPTVQELTQIALDAGIAQHEIDANIRMDGGIGIYGPIQPHMSARDTWVA